MGTETKVRKSDRALTPNRLREMHFSYVAEAKLRRLIELIILLQSSRMTVPQLADRIDHSERTVYRYIKLLESVDFVIEKDFEDRYFIVKNPLCGGELHHG